VCTCNPNFGDEKCETCVEGFYLSGSSCFGQFFIYFIFSFFLSYHEHVSDLFFSQNVSAPAQDRPTQTAVGQEFVLATQAMLGPSVISVLQVSLVPVVLVGDSLLFLSLL